MKKSLKLMIATSLLFSQITPIASAENISPIETIEWGAEESAQENQSQSEIDAQDNLADSVPEETESINESEAEDLASDNAKVEQADVEEVVLDGSTPTAFIESLMGQARRTVEFTQFVTEGDSVGVASQRILKDHDRYYTAQLVPPFLPSSQFIESNRQDVQVTYLSVDDLVKYATDAMTTQPQIYKGTVVDDFYAYSQANRDKLEGKVVVMDTPQNALNEASLTLFQIEDYLSAVVQEWVQDEEVVAAFEANELGQQVLVSGDLAKSFNDIAATKKADYPALPAFFTQWDGGFEGTVNIDTTNGVLGIGLVKSGSTQEASEGIEIYIGASVGVILDFEEESLLTYDKFVELVGSDVIKEVADFEASLTPDMFQVTTDEVAE